MSAVSLVINPAAGGGSCGRKVDGWIDRLRTAGVDVEAHRTRRPGDAVEIAEQLAHNGVDAVIAVGGDGTLHEVANGLMQFDGPRPALGVLPLGTGNSFARDFGQHDAEQAFRALVSGKRREVDILQVAHAEGQLYSLNLVSLGFVAEVGGLTNRRFKPLGPLGYVAATVVTVARLSSPVIPIRVGERSDARPAVFLCFCNSQYTGGAMQMAPAADPSDGLLDVIRVGHMGRLRLLRLFPRIFKGTHVAAPEIEASTAVRVDFDLDQAIPALVDGEALNLQLERIEVLPAALEWVG